MSQQSQERYTKGHPVFAAVYDFQGRWREEKFMREHREYLAEDLRGSVLNIGPGTGDMFPYFKRRQSAIHRSSFMQSNLTHI